MRVPILAAVWLAEARVARASGTDSEGQVKSRPPKDRWCRLGSSFG